MDRIGRRLEMRSLNCFIFAFVLGALPLMGQVVVDGNNYKHFLSGVWIEEERKDIKNPRSIIEMSWGKARYVQNFTFLFDFLAKEPFMWYYIPLMVRSTSYKDGNITVETTHAQNRYIHIRVVSDKLIEITGGDPPLGRLYYRLEGPPILPSGK